VTVRIKLFFPSILLLKLYWSRLWDRRLFTSPSRFLARASAGKHRVRYLQFVIKPKFNLRTRDDAFFGKAPCLLCGTESSGQTSRLSQKILALLLPWLLWNGREERED